MDVKKTKGRDFRTQLDIALFYFSMSLGRTPARTMVTDGVTDSCSCGNRIYIREREDQ